MKRRILFFCILSFLGAMFWAASIRLATAQASDGATTPTIAASSVPSAPDAAESAPPEEEGRLVKYAGKFHILTIHYPIALLTAAALAEFLGMFVAGRKLPDAARYCLWVAALSALAVVPLGWAAASSGGYDGPDPYLLDRNILFWHRWSGTATGLLAVATLAVCEIARRKDRSGWSLLYRAMLFGSAALVGFSAHLGGLMANGLDYFDFS